MDERVAAEFDACTVCWDADLSAVVGRWHEAVSGAAYHEPMDEMVALLAEEDGTKLLGDCRNLGQVPEPDQTWTRDDWLPRAVDAGLEYSAIVYPDSVDGRTTVDKMARSDPDPMVERVFTHTVDEARGWLLAQ